MEISTGEQLATEVAKVLDKQQPLTRDDLQVLRRGSSIAQMSFGINPTKFRIDIESIDAAVKLDLAITKLDRTSGRLAYVGIAVAVVGIILAGAQVLVGLGILA